MSENLERGKISWNREVSLALPQVDEVHLAVFTQTVLTHEQGRLIWMEILLSWRRSRLRCIHLRHRVPSLEGRTERPDLLIAAKRLQEFSVISHKQDGGRQSTCDAQNVMMRQFGQEITLYLLSNWADMCIRMCVS